MKLVADGTEGRGALAVPKMGEESLLWPGVFSRLRGIDCEHSGVIMYSVSTRMTPCCFPLKYESGVCKTSCCFGSLPFKRLRMQVGVQITHEHVEFYLVSFWEPHFLVFWNIHPAHLGA